MTSLPSVYLDNAATTPCDPRVVDAMLPWLREHFGNPASRSHAWGREAADAVERAREQVARLVHADASEIVWTSGATESNNLALIGAAHARRERGRHLVTVKTEHRAVLDTMQALARQGFEVDCLDVEPDGRIDPARFARALRADTTLASVMLVNNEIGVVQDIATIGALCRERGIVLHVDAAQATGKVAIDFARLPVDLMSLTAHKTYGPKGIGALVVRRKPRVRLEPQLHGGGHERGLRSGTLATHQCVGMGEAFRLAGEEMGEELDRLRTLQQRLRAGLEAIGGVELNGSLEHRVPHNLNVSLAGVDAEELMLAAGDVAMSTGSACASGSAGPSHVLRALGCSDARAHSSLRLTLGRFTSAEDIDRAVECLRQGVARLARSGGQAIAAATTMS